ELVFNIPLTSLGVFGSGGSSGNWDYLEVGIDNVLFDVVCFAKGTSIKTETDHTHIENLQIGDTVQTADGNVKPVRWIGSRKITVAHLKANPKLYPIRISAGALGNSLPKRDLLVSRQHRILVSSKVAERMFGVKDVLIPAIKLTALDGIFIDQSVQDIEYFHMLLDDHEMVLAEGAPSETLLTGAQCLNTLTPAAKKEVLALFPNIEAEISAPKTVRLVPARKQQKRLIDRHAQHKKPLLELFNAQL
ncbi:Hint domain-containing protein, partial [Planktotalea sp.]|uniref:Hint domain-containing protein n=1 Tax=Planktotalea sp. TaxID=2029877 RepID=UPI003299F503